LLFNGEWSEENHFEPATNREFAEVKALGQNAVAPLARYLGLQPKDDLSQFFAVKFLIAIGGTSTLDPLEMDRVAKETGA
jgi:hypothetical protein